MNETSVDKPDAHKYKYYFDKYSHLLLLLLLLYIELNAIYNKNILL